MEPEMNDISIISWFFFIWGSISVLRCITLYYSVLHCITLYLKHKLQFSLVSGFVTILSIVIPG